jgi:hypothetical protein
MHAATFSIYGRPDRQRHLATATFMLCGQRGPNQKTTTPGGSTELVGEPTEQNRMRLILPFAEETEVDRLPRPGDSKTETADVRSRTEAGRKDRIIFCFLWV